MDSRTSISRRSVLRGIGAFGAAGAVVGAGTTKRLLAADDLVVGVAYAGAKDDYGWNQGHAVGVAALKKLDGVTVVEEENVPETVESQKTMESMINFDGAGLIFMPGFGYWDHMLKVAAKYPDVEFLYGGPLVWEEGMPDNAGSYNGYIDQAQYISGVVAGHATESGKLGFVAAKPYPASIRNVNSFTLGARSINPGATMQVVVTGDWVLPVKEAEAVNSLADQGIDVVTCHVDAPKVVVETAEKRGIYSSGYHTDQSVLAPNGYLTGAIWNWQKVYTDYVNWLRDGVSWPHLVRGGLKEGIVTNVPYGSAVSADARKDADAALASFMDGSFQIYKGPMMTNDGRTAIPDGTGYAQNAPWLESMNWFVEGVVGTTGA